MVLDLSGELCLHSERAIQLFAVHLSKNRVCQRGEGRQWDAIGHAELEIVVLLLAGFEADLGEKVGQLVHETRNRGLTRLELFDVALEREQAF